MLTNICLSLTYLKVADIISEPVLPNKNQACTRDDVAANENIVFAQSTVDGTAIRKNYAVLYEETHNSEMPAAGL